MRDLVTFTPAPCRNAGPVGAATLFFHPAGSAWHRQQCPCPRCCSSVPSLRWWEGSGPVLGHDWFPGASEVEARAAGKRPTTARHNSWSSPEFRLFLSNLFYSPTNSPLQDLQGKGNFHQVSAHREPGEFICHCSQPREPRCTARGRGSERLCPKTHSCER